MIPFKSFPLVMTFLTLATCITVISIVLLEQPTGVQERVSLSGPMQLFPLLQLLSLD